MPEGTGSLRKEDGQWFFDSPLVEANLGQNIPVVITQQETVDGESQTWLVLEDHPDWPLFIQNDDGSWRQAMRYIEMTQRFVPTDYDTSTLYGGNTKAFQVYRDRIIFDDGIKVSYEYYSFSPVVAGEPYRDEQGNWIGIFAIQLDHVKGLPMVLFYIVLQPGVIIDDNFIMLQWYLPAENSFELTKRFGNHLPLPGHREEEQYIDLVKLLSNSIGKQISLAGYATLGSLPKEENVGETELLFFQTVMKNQVLNDKILRNFAFGRYVEVQKGLYIWGLDRVWMDYINWQH